MSSTNRGRERKLDDFYETPYWTTQLLLNYENLIEPILEPAVGKGKIVDVLRENNYKDIIGIDINSDYTPDICEDFLKWNKDKTFNTIITNPPYISALEYISKSLRINKGGINIFLLRLNFLESIKRYQFWKDNMPSHIYVLSERPKFYLGRSDSIAYAWFVWKPNNKKTTLSVISKQELNKWI